VSSNLTPSANPHRSQKPLPCGGTKAATALLKRRQTQGGQMSIIWIIIIGFVAGVIAKFITPGPNEPQGFILTTVLGIIGAFIATYLGQAIGWYQADQGAGLIGAIVGAVIVLTIWGLVTRQRAT
jgi:uncharacterized membrane protein YeaQ/YmgE (transglycosylase-associated protein family)